MPAPGMHSGVATDEALNLSMSEHAIPLYEAVKAFIENEVDPITEEYYRLGEGRAEHWGYGEGQLELLDGVKAKAKANGLWNFFLPNAETGEGLSNLDYAYIANELGKSPLASECLNCSAPDTGNMEVLERVGTREQKEQWLKPLLAGEIRSAYVMTEPDVAVVGRQEPRVLRRGGRRRVGHQRREVLRLGRRRPPLQDLHRHAAHELGRPAPPAPHAGPRAGRHARRREARRDAGLRRGRRPARPPPPEVRQRPRAEGEHAARRRQGLRDQPGPPRTGPHPPLHALDRRRPRRRSS